MRIDLIPERDRFIPGWHNWPEPCQAEQFSPKWRRPGRLPGAVRALLGGLLEACYAIHPQHCWATRGPGGRRQRLANSSAGKASAAAHSDI